MLDEKVCGEHSGLCNNVAALSKQLDNHINANTGEHDKMWVAIDLLRNRLPTWATLVLALLTGLLGWSFK